MCGERCDKITERPVDLGASFSPGRSMYTMLLTVTDKSHWKAVHATDPSWNDKNREYRKVGALKYYENI